VPEEDLGGGPASTDAVDRSIKGASVAAFSAVLIVMALEAEADGMFHAAGIPVLFCGVGKINAAAALVAELTRYRIAGKPLPLVVNFGSVGSRSLPTGTLLECRRFFQRDMDVRALGFELGQTPYDPLPAILESEPRFGHLPNASCGTGDSFAIAAAELVTDVVDMEAYALAKVCHSFGAAFACAKYVTDGADHTASDDWQANVHKAAERFLELARRLA
jgi:adenosylhomocysteine nucleosidase